MLLPLQHVLSGAYTCPELIASGNAEWQ